MIPAGPPTRAAATVIGAWFFLAWNRLGFQGVAMPRVMVRFVLVGVYGWFWFVLALWFGQRFLARRSDNGGGDVRAEPTRLLQVTGLAHQSLLVLAIVLQIGQAIPIPVIAPALTLFVFLVWLPGALVAATSQATPTATTATTGLAVMAYLVWLVTVGRYLLDQIGHLI